MGTSAEESQGNQQSQQYDTTFKDWIEQQAGSILPILLPGASYQGTLTVELIRPTLRADKVFKILYHGKERIFNPEFETGSDNRMAARLSAYNAILYHDHNIPVISMIIYPFRTKMAESPLLIPEEDGSITRFNFLTLALFLEDAERYVREHVHCMYPLLPAMQGTNRVMIRRVLGELKELYREDTVTLAQQCTWMNLLLARTTTISPSEKAAIFKEFEMDKAILEQSPVIRQILAEKTAEEAAKARDKGRAEGRVEGRAEGVSQGELLALRRVLVYVVKAQYPTLTELAQEKAERFSKPDALDLLVQQVSTAPNEETARWLLSEAA